MSRKQVACQASEHSSKDRNLTFYRIDSTRLSYREYWWVSRNPAEVLLLCFLKLLHIPIRVGSDEPMVDSVRALEELFENLPNDIQERMAPRLEKNGRSMVFIPLFSTQY